jgi:hypothetical protein
MACRLRVTENPPPCIRNCCRSLYPDRGLRYPPGTADSQRSSKTRVYVYRPSDSPDHCGVVGAFFLPATGPRILPTMPARAEALQFLHHRRCLLRPAVHFIPGPRRQTEIGCPCPDETMQRVSEELQEALETTRRCNSWLLAFVG